jgi:hypothetical protein
MCKITLYKAFKKDILFKGVIMINLYTTIRMKTAANHTAGHFNQQTNIEAKSYIQQSQDTTIN